MRRARINLLGVAVVLLTGSAVWSMERAAAAPTEPTPLDVPAAEADLVVGDWYEVDVKRGRAEDSLGGCLIRATDRWVVLRQITTERGEVGVPFFARIPFLNTVFRYSYTIRSEDNLWIPREAATVKSHLRGAAAYRPIASTDCGTEPPTSAGCMVERAVGAKAVSLRGELTVIDEQSLTVRETDKRTRRQQVARGDLLCVTVFGPNWPNDRTPELRKALDQRSE